MKSLDYLFEDIATLEKQQLIHNDQLRNVAAKGKCNVDGANEVYKDKLKKLKEEYNEKILD